MARYGEDAAKGNKKVLFVMALVVLAVLYFFVWPVLNQKPAPAPVNTDAGMPVPVAPPSASPTQTSKDKKVALVAMVGPLTGKPIQEHPIAP